MFQLEKNKKLQALSQKKDLDLLTDQASSFSYKWLKSFFLYKKKSETLKVAWSLPKKYIPNSVTRNRLKRWGRENLKESSLNGMILMVFLKTRDKNFYKELKRKDFDSVFNNILEKLYSKT